MSRKYMHLNKPLTIGSVTIKNRFIVAPMDTGPTLLGPDGEFNENRIDYFVRRAQGGFALLYLGGQQIDDVVDHNPKTIKKIQRLILRRGRNSMQGSARMGQKCFCSYASALGVIYRGCMRR